LVKGRGFGTVVANPGGLGFEVAHEELSVFNRHVVGGHEVAKAVAGGVQGEQLGARHDVALLLRALAANALNLLDKEVQTLPELLTY
jgi:hypothetical protein